MQFTRLNELKQVLDNMQQLEQIVDEILNCRATRMCELVELFPKDLGEAINYFESLVIWKKTKSNDQIPEPIPGLCVDFDNANRCVDLVKSQIE